MTMSLYAKYLLERTGDMIVEDERGFATYRYLDGGATVYIVDIFTLPEWRKTGHAARLADRISDEARAKGAKELLGTVVPTANGSTTSLKVLLAYGMELKSAGDNLIIFRKGL